MKKFTSLLISFILLLSTVLSVNANGFTDLSESHWAYKNIQVLVEEGTVNGYTDGSFQPSKTVTRAEFVKMIGKWDRVYEGTFSDLDAQHWGYEYLMWSGLEPDGDKIYPDKEMMRADVINLIWKRNGSPKHQVAPSAITKQGTNEDATSWAYTIGLVQGDDGFHLHLDRALTRAEAATLIIRSRSVVAANKRHEFLGVVKEDLLERVYDSTGLFPNKAYAKDTTVTYGELARATMILAAGGKPVTYSNMGLNPDVLFEHTYSQDMYILANNLWGKDYYTTKKIEQKANVQDALSALIYGMFQRGGQLINLGKTNAYYSDCIGANSTTLENLCLSYAKENGIKLTTGTALGAMEEVTLEKIAALLVQIDAIAGLELGYKKDGSHNTSTNLELASYPANYADYKYIVKDIPNKVYNIKQENTKPITSYEKASHLSFVFSNCLQEVKSLIFNQHKITMDYTLYPSLIYEENGKYVFIAKCTVSTKDFDADTVFASMLKDKTNLQIKVDQDFYVVFETYESLMDIYLPYKGVYIKTIIAN